MSSTDGDEEDHSFSSPFQSAQQPTDQVYAEIEDTDIDSESSHLPDAPSGHGASLLSSQRKATFVDDPGAKRFGVEDDVNEDSQDTTALPSRPNKFRGPPSTWRNWTAPERDLAASLDQLQAKDLSIHLYNSFKLGQKNRVRKSGRRTRTLEDSKEANKRSKWVPPRIWTAWPLPPDIVPREQSEKRWEDDAILPMPHHISPRRVGQHLQEMLVAQVLRIAKERFYERQLDDAPPPLGTTNTAQGQQSHGFERDFNKRSSAEYNHDDTGQKPVVTANDERASEILQATVQHVMTKLDNLLMGLHHARSAYLLNEASGSESPSPVSERSASRGRRQKRKREASTSSEDAEASHDVQDHPSSDSSDNINNHPSRQKPNSQRNTRNADSSSRRSPSLRFHDRKRHLGLRDWSDVLGIASMTGWPQNVVGNTSTRCAMLFDEGIKFRTLEEGREHYYEEHLYLPNAPPLITSGSSHYSQSHIWQEGRKARGGEESDDEMVGGVHVDGFLKPVEGKKSRKDKKGALEKRRRSSRKTGGGVSMIEERVSG